MRPLFVVGFLVFSTWGGQAVHAQPAAGAAPHIEWEVKSRFRLFRNEADFERHAAAMRSGGVLAAERRLASETDGRGWARDTIDRLCVDRAGRLLEFCDRDGERESYLAPRDHRVGVALAAGERGLRLELRRRRRPPAASERPLRRRGKGSSRQ